MDTTVTKCDRCSGEGGAHFAYCYLAQLWDRVMGATHPWSPPKPKGPLFTLDEVQDIVQNVLAASKVEEPPVPAEPWVEGDPPDPQGVMEDFLIGSGHMESDAVWMPKGIDDRSQDDEDWLDWLSNQEEVGQEFWRGEGSPHAGVHAAELVTHLPDGYYDDLPDPEPPDEQAQVEQLQLPTSRLGEGPRRYHAEQRQVREDEAVQFLYDCLVTTPGSRTLMTDVYDRYIEWATERKLTVMSKIMLRDIVRETGIEITPGRLPGMRNSGKAPLLVCGQAIKADDHKARPPAFQAANVKPQPKVRTKHPLLGDKPGGEIPKQLRELIEPLLTEQGWRYQPNGRAGRGRPRVINPDGFVCTLPSTPHLNGRTLENTRTFLKSKGARL